MYDEPLDAPQVMLHDLATWTLHHGEKVVALDSQFECFNLAMLEMVGRNRKVATILDPAGMPAVTLVPTRPDECIVVWRDGTTARWSQLTDIEGVVVGIVKGQITKAG